MTRRKGDREGCPFPLQKPTNAIHAHRQGVIVGRYVKRALNYRKANADRRAYWAYRKRDILIDAKVNDMIRLLDKR